MLTLFPKGLLDLLGVTVLTVGICFGGLFCLLTRGGYAYSMVIPRNVSSSSVVNCYDPLG